MSKTQTIEKRPQETTVVTETPGCRHHWKIESPRGALSLGRCKICGEEREFRNSTTDYSWDDDSGSGSSPWRGIRSTPKVADDDEMAAASRTGREALVV